MCAVPAGYWCIRTTAWPWQPPRGGNDLSLGAEPMLHSTSCVLTSLGLSARGRLCLPARRTAGQGLPGSSAGLTHLGGVYTS